MNEPIRPHGPMANSTLVSYLPVQPAALSEPPAQAQAAPAFDAARLEPPPSQADRAVGARVLRQREASAIEAPPPKRPRLEAGASVDQATATWDDEPFPQVDRAAAPSPSPDDWDRLAHGTSGAVLCDGKALTEAALYLAVAHQPEVDQADEGLPAQVFTDKLDPAVLVMVEGPAALGATLAAGGDCKSLKDALEQVTQAYRKQTSHWPVRCGVWAAADTRVERPLDMPGEAVHRLPAGSRQVLLTRGVDDARASARVEFPAAPHFVTDRGCGLELPD